MILLNSVVTDMTILLLQLTRFLLRKNDPAFYSNVQTISFVRRST
jgi:hypothetical protein